VYALGFRHLLPDFTAYLRGHACLVAEGDVTPSPLAETYRVRVEYAADDWPKVWVKSPALVPREPGGRIPHMYGQERLCLFYTRSDEWSGDMYVADTVVPWAAEWLHYYELWHATGDWLGGGREPRDGEPVRRARQPEVTRGKRRR
jgi:hypothetical protein